MRVVMVLALLVGIARAEKAPGPTTTKGVLLEDAKATHCGRLDVWTVLHFDVSGDPNGPRGTKVDPKRIPVAIQCIELVKPPLAKGKTYQLELAPPRADPKWGKRMAWAASKVALVP